MSITFTTGEVRPQSDVARHVREPAVQLDGVAPRGAAEQARLARVGPEQAEQDADGGRLAGPVGPEEAVDLARRHLEIQAVESPRLPNVFTKSLISMASLTGHTVRSAAAIGQAAEVAAQPDRSALLVERMVVLRNSGVHHHVRCHRDAAPE